MDLSTARMLLRRLPAQAGRRGAVQFGRSFLFSGVVSSDGQPVPSIEGRTPVQALIGDEVAFKTYATLVLMTKTYPHDLYRSRTATELAEILGYDQVTPPRYETGPGTRRVRRALRNLEQLGLIVVRPGESRAEIIVRVTHMPDPELAPFISVPTTLWSHGWILGMRPPAIAVYMFLRLTGARKSHAGPRSRHQLAIDRADWNRTGLHDDTRKRGLAELTKLGVIDIRRAPVTDRYGRRRVNSQAILIDDDRISQDTLGDAANTPEKWTELWGHTDLGKDHAPPPPPDRLRN